MVNFKLPLSARPTKAASTRMIDDDAKIQLNDKDIKLKELKKGDEVKVTYEKSEGKLVASKVECKRDFG
jgi:hypothetical protein